MTFELRIADCGLRICFAVRRFPFAYASSISVSVLANSMSGDFAAARFRGFP